MIPITRGRLEEHLDRELKRTRSVVPVAVLRGRNAAEAAGLEVQLLRLREGWRVGGVEGLRAELEAERIRDCEVLEKRGVQVVVVRSARLLDAARAERRVIDLSNLGSRRRRSERAGVEPLRVVVRSGVETLSGYHVGGATEVGRRGDGASDRERLPALEGIEAADLPPAHDEIRDPVHVGAELLATAEGQGIGGGGVPQVGGVGVAEAVVAFDTEPLEPLGAVT